MITIARIVHLTYLVRGQSLIFFFSLNFSFISQSIKKIKIELN